MIANDRRLGDEEGRLRPRHLERLAEGGIAMMRVNGIRHFCIGGPRETLEFDESCFAKKQKYNRGNARRRRRKARWVFGAVERTRPHHRGRFRAWCVPDRKRRTLVPIIVRNFHPDSRMISDNWGAYEILGSLGYDHSMVNHSLEFVDPNDPSIHTETIEGRWMHVKRHLNTLGGTRDSELQERIDEYSFFLRYLQTRNKRVWRVLRCVALHGVRAKRYVQSLSQRLSNVGGSTYVTEDEDADNDYDVDEADDEDDVEEIYVDQSDDEDEEEDDDDDDDDWMRD